jgi:hypothetical protein
MTKFVHCSDVEAEVRDVDERRDAGRLGAEPDDRRDGAADEPGHSALGEQAGVGDGGHGRSPVTGQGRTGVDGETVEHRRTTTGTGRTPGRSSERSVPDTLQQA